MSAIFGSNQETATDRMIRQKMEDEKAEKIKLEKAEQKKKVRLAKGLIGPRSLMSKAGGSGFWET